MESFDREMERLEGLSDGALESLSTLIGAADMGGVARKLCRIVLGVACPGEVVGRLALRDAVLGAQFCMELAGYREFMDRVLAGESPAVVATAVARAQRDRLNELDVSADSGRDEDLDVFDADGEIDPGALRAEVDRLLHRLHVEPERVAVQILPDDEP